MADVKKIKQKIGESDYGEVLFKWSFPEFERHQREQGWYVGAAVIVVLLIIYSIWAANFLFGLITIITALTVLLFHNSDNIVKFKITEDGLFVNNKFFDYKEINNFYIIYEPPQVKMLYFEPKSIFNPRIPIPLEDQDPVKIREVLRRYLQEDLEKENEPTSDQMSRWLKL